MKSIFKSVLALLVSSFIIFSCSTSNEPIDPALLNNASVSIPVVSNPINPGTPVTPTPNTPAYAMTAKINGQQFQANSVFGGNAFSPSNIWTYFPVDDFVLLQGRQGGPLGIPEINIWLKRSDITLGTFSFGRETFNTTPSHFMDLNDAANPGQEYTISGSLTILEVNATAKTVKGTFVFTTTADLFPAIPVVNFTVTEGTFNYKYTD